MNYQKNYGILPALTMPLVVLLLGIISLVVLIGGFIGGVLWIKHIVNQPGPGGIPVGAILVLGILIVVIWWKWGRK